MGNSNSKDGSSLEDFGIEYASAIESTSLVNIKDKYGLFINGNFVESSSGKSFKTLDPSTEKPLSVVTEASSDDVDRAVRAASVSYEKYWKKM